MTQTSRVLPQPLETTPEAVAPQTDPAPASRPARPAESADLPPEGALAAVREIRTRLHVLRWFSPQTIGRRGQAERVAGAVVEHARNARLDSTPSSLRLIGGAAGVAALRDGEIDLMRPRWQQRLMEAMDRLAEALQAVPRARHHSLFEVCGDSVSLRPEALPIPQDRLWKQLSNAGGLAPGLAPTMTRELLDRMLWEIGGATGWELMRDRLGPNPFLPLLTLYEEGLYPLELAGDTAILWAPGA